MFSWMASCNKCMHKKHRKYPQANIYDRSFLVPPGIDCPPPPLFKTLDWKFSPLESGGWYLSVYAAYHMYADFFASRFFCEHFSRARICIHLFPDRLSLFVFDVCLNWIFLKIEIKKLLRLPSIKFSVTIFSLKRDFHLSPHAA